MFEPLPLRTRKGALQLGRPSIIGVLNTTPDSFSDGGKFLDPGRAEAWALALEAAGAQVIDVGGESTRPGAAAVSAQQEIDRVVPVIRRLAGRLRVPLSIDTRKAAVAEAALEAGADVVNDVSGLADPDLGRVAARYHVPVILGHLRGEPSTMQEHPCFKDVVAEVIEELAATVDRAVACGIERDQVIVDPGLGFGKTTEQTVALLAATREIRARIGRPVCVGPSRKSFLGALTGAGVERRLIGTAAATAIAVFLGADFVRLHDVGDLRDAVVVAAALRAARHRAQFAGVQRPESVP